MATEKNYKLDLFNQLLPAIDKRDFGFYSRLTDEEKKGFAGVVALRAMSGCPDSDRDMCEYAIQAANEANKDFWNSQLTKHPELQYLILASMGIGGKIRHEWIKAPNSKKVNTKITDVLRRYYPSISNDEMQLFIDINDADSLLEIGKMLGLQKDEMNEYKKEIKKVKKDDE